MFRSPEPLPEPARPALSTETSTVGPGTDTATDTGAPGACWTALVTASCTIR
jgi:hypothetical protein